MATRKTTPARASGSGQSRRSPGGGRTGPNSRTLTFFEDATAGPRQSLESGPQAVDGFHWLHVWVEGRSLENLALDRVLVQVLFVLPGRMETSNLADFTVSAAPKVEPLAAESGPPAGGSGGFVVRAPIVGPAVRVMVLNLGEHTYDFSAFGHLTR